SMDVSCQQFFAGTGFPTQKDPGIRPGHQRRLLDGIFEYGARSDHPRFFTDDLAKLLVFTLQARLLDRILDDNQNLVPCQRLLEKVECARAQRLDGISDCTVAGDHDCRNLKNRQELDPIAIWQPYIQKTNVGPVSRDFAVKLGCRSAHNYVVSLAFEYHL